LTRRARLDAELVRRGLARSRAEAADLVTAGRVTVAGLPAARPATGVDASTPLAVRTAGDGTRYASRGGLKLAGALDDLGAVAVSGRRCLDAGASTGGFTDVLLRRGAREVVAVDVGYGQLDWRLRNDPRVHVLDRTNVRSVTADDLGGAADLTVADLSFISLRTVLPTLAACTRGEMVLLVKPQFEVGREQVGSGVVRDPALREGAVLDVARAAAGLGLGTAGVVASRFPGPAGNVEYFLHLRRGAPAPDPESVHRAVETGPA
jgi:23S rRNA (cytidine1920-2'-O)/16S rRNA (cytidine1409-2'-O)-methyltransferase